MTGRHEVREVRVPEASELPAAWKVVSSRLAATPLDRNGDPWLKLESLQPMGSFKARGALNALTNAPTDANIVTASAGNHGLGLAYAAKLLDRRITVVVPEDAAPPKVEALLRQGVDLIQTGDTYQAAEDYALGLADAYYLSPYNDPDVITGQATIGFELEQQVPGPVTVVCGVGGGGLASGLGLWASRYPDARIVGVEAAVSTAVSSAIAAGRDVQVSVGDSIADGITGNIERGTVTVGLIEQYVHQMVTVTEDEIHDAVRYLVTRRGIVAEGAGAAPVAALLNDRVDVRGRAVAVVSGRNIALPVLAEILGSGSGSGSGSGF